MTWMKMSLLVLGGLSIASLPLWVADRIRVRRLYRKRVGLDVAELVNLLPEQLRGRTYTSFMLAPWDGKKISVGLIYDDGTVRRGNPANVGLDFDLHTGALLEIHPEGIGLGLA